MSDIVQPWPKTGEPWHVCEGPTPHTDDGPAIDGCYELGDGTFWAGNGEVTSRVNFCPYCGTAAPTPNVVPS